MMEISTSLEGCEGKQKQQLEQLIESYKKLFQELKVYRLTRKSNMRFNFSNLHYLTLGCIC
jgi:hypothetical protein